MNLQAVVSPLSKDEFLSDYWPLRPLTIPGTEDRLPAIKDLPALASAETVLNGYSDRVSLMRPDGFWSEAPSGAEAVPFLESGHTCYLRRVDRHIPEIDGLVQTITTELGMPAGSFTGEIFCSRGESGVGMHSDYDVNFAMLLHGRKVWKFAPNTNIRNQTNICLPSTRKQVDDTQLELADETPFPAAMPQDATEVEMLPGGLVFIPRGQWHQTQSYGDCMQLNIVMKGPHWISVLTRALEKRLITDPAWRAYAYGVAGDKGQREGAEEAFAGVLAGLQKDLAGSSPLELARELIAQAEL